MRKQNSTVCAMYSMHFRSVLCIDYTWHFGVVRHGFVCSIATNCITPHCNQVCFSALYQERTTGLQPVTSMQRYAMYCSAMKHTTVQCNILQGGASMTSAMLQCNMLECSGSAVQGGLVWPVLSQDGKITCSPSQQHPPTRKSRFTFFQIFFSQKNESFAQKVAVFLLLQY